MFVVNYKMHIAIFIFAFLFGSATAQPMEAGTYIATDAGGWSQLKIDLPKANKSQVFSIESLGQNGHSCTLKGLLLRGIASNKLEEGGRSCFAKVLVKPEGVEFPELFTSSGESCHSEFCGVRASYDGSYKKVPVQCLNLHARHKQFQKHYLAKNYIEASKILSLILELCSAYIFWVDRALWINDLAITRFHMADLKECIALLEPLKEDYILSTTNLRSSPGITEEEWFSRISKASRFNWQKCGGKLPPSKFKAQ